MIEWPWSARKGLIILRITTALQEIYKNWGSGTDSISIYGFITEWHDCQTVNKRQLQSGD